MQPLKLKVPSRSHGLLVDIPFLSLLIIALVTISRFNYLLFHSLIEAAIAAVTFTAFAFAWNSRRFEHGYLLLVGICCGCVGLFGTLHALAFKGMTVFNEYGPNLAAQLWIASRYLLSVTLLVAPFFLGRALPLVPALLALTLSSAVLIAFIFLHQFPVCFVEGVGLTAFKIWSEVIISWLLLVGLALMWWKRKFLPPLTFRYLNFYFLFSISAGLAFTAYFSFYDFSNMVGHILQLIAAYAFYKAIVETGMRQPVELLFRELTEAVRVRDEFLSVASHELKTPLTPLKLQLQNVQRALKNQREFTPEQTSRMVELSTKQIDRLTSLIENLLDVSRFSSGKLQLNHELVDLPSLLREIVGRHETELRSSGCTLRVNTPPTMPPLLADLLRLDQVLTNLFINALKYAPGSAVELGADLGPGEMIRIWVKDSGPGVPAELQSRMFEQFERGSNNKVGGLGLGLFISRQIIEAHGGKIQLLPGPGASFEISLPLN